MSFGCTGAIGVTGVMGPTGAAGLEAGPEPTLGGGGGNFETTGFAAGIGETGVPPKTWKLLDQSLNALFEVSRVSNGSTHLFVGLFKTLRLLGHRLST